ITVACLAVATRASLAKIPRTHHEITYQKLTGLDFCWKKTEKIWGPIVETLVQILVIPVGLFLVGLIDNLLSTSLPISQPKTPVFVGGVISCVCCAFAGTFTLYTLLRDSLEDPDSIFNSKFLSSDTAVTATGSISTSQYTNRARLWFPDYFQVFSARPPFQTIDEEAVTAVGQQKPLQLKKPLKRWSNILPKFHWHKCMPGDESYVSLGDIDGIDSFGIGNPLDLKYHKAYHAVVSTTHDDDALDRAVTALASLLRDRRRIAFPGYVASASKQEVDTFKHLLSVDVSTRCNLTAADVIWKSLLPDKLNQLSGELDSIEYILFF
ncbi:hypothetical protein H0H87_006904, partial [Tephrocybe sp. NHM501043]